MRSVKVYNADTKCIKCNNTVSRKRAEAADWIEISYVDNTGMPVTKAICCNLCAENWVADLYIPDGTTPPETTPTVQEAAV